MDLAPVAWDGTILIRVVCAEELPRSALVLLQSVVAFLVSLWGAVGSCVRNFTTNCWDQLPVLQICA